MAMMVLLLLLAPLLLALPVTAAGPVPAIVTVTATATSAERHAAAELAAFLCKIAARPGGFSVRSTEDVGVLEPQIAVGAGAALRLGLNADALQGLGLEGYLAALANNGSSLVLTGGTRAPRGALYAVNFFLESIGVRFLAVDVTKLPAAIPDAIPQACHHHVFVPQLEYRQLMEWQAGPMMTNSSYDYCVHRRVDPLAQPDTGVAGEPVGDAARGGGVVYASPPGFVHTSYRILDPTWGGNSPPPQLLAKHPEWFWPRTGPPTYGQLCWANASLQQFIIGNLKQQLRKQPNATIVSVTTHYHHLLCIAASCTAMLHRLTTAATLCRTGEPKRQPTVLQ
jgi:hypothetical protein